MFKQSRTAILIGFGIVAAALAGCEQETVSKSRYQCGDDRVIHVSFVDGKHVVVTLDDVEYKINRVESASGAKYESSSDGALFWSKGMDAMFIPDRATAPLQCRRG